jgi:hypothetical protein
MTTQVIDSPVGDLEWVFIDGEGKKDLQDVPKYQVDVVLTPETAKSFVKLVEKFWEDNKPKGAKDAKSLGIYPHMVKDEEASKEAGENVYKETGNTVVRFKTNITYASGDPKVIKIFNSKGNEISLHGKKIGNGSRGRVNGVMAIYNINKATCGVSFYLNAIQLSKFVEFTGGANFDEIEDGDFEGVEGEMGGIADEQSDAPTKPRL